MILNLKTFIVCTLLLLVSAALEAGAQGTVRERIRQRFEQRAHGDKQLPLWRQPEMRGDVPGRAGSETLKIAGLDVAVWQSAHSAGPAPLVIFSHGFHGINTQTPFLMKALADAGYLVMAPNHKDAIGLGLGLSNTDEKMADTAAWNDQTHKDRYEDIVNLLGALHKDPQWNAKIDWSKLVLAGHSLGGYTALGCAGAWPSWKIPGVKAVLALSPYCQPFAKHETLKNVHVPVMYQSGTRDIGILPFIKRRGGALDQTASPVYLVVFDKASHFAFCSFNHDPAQMELIDHYSLAFLDKYVRGNANARPEIKLAGVTELDTRLDAK